MRGCRHCRAPAGCPAPRLLAYNELDRWFGEARGAMTKPERILARELLGREVLDLARGEAAGTIHDFVLDREGRVTLLGVLPQAWYEGGRAVAPGSISR